MCRNYYQKLWAMALTVMLFVLLPLATLAEVILVNAEKIRVTGQVSSQTATQFTEILKKFPSVTTVELDSPGGFIYPALKIADAVHRAELNTWITGKSQCYSACSLIFLSGNMRLADGKLGVHQISGIDDPSLTQTVVSDVYDALNLYRTPDKLISIMLRTRPEDMYVFSRDEIDKLGINILPGYSRNAVVPHLQVKSSRVYGDWLVGTFANNRTKRPFVALESRVMDPIMRIVHYPHSYVTFLEIIWDEEFLAEGQTDLRFRFYHGQDVPYDFWITVQTDAHGIYFDFPLKGEEKIELFLTAFVYGTSLKVYDFSGREMASFSLVGSMKASSDFASMMGER